MISPLDALRAEVDTLLEGEDDLLDTLQVHRPPMDSDWAAVVTRMLQDLRLDNVQVEVVEGAGPPWIAGARFVPGWAP